MNPSGGCLLLLQGLYRARLDSNGSSYVSFCTICVFSLPRIADVATHHCILVESDS
jgi:hypothetical protein